MLYDIFIYPIEFILKFIFETCYSYSDSYIVSTILLSLIVSIALIPFYYWAEKLQNKESEILRKLKPSVDEFKSVYSGWKLHAVTSTLYKQNNYHPIYSLRSIMGLLIQLPFFIAAYHFLLTYEPIMGVETWLYKDLGAPDAWIHIGSLHINAMPFIMTAVNLVSGFIFTRGMTKAEEIQTWVLALVFLVLLYTSPALLVLYWTMNNLFSLIRNLLKKRFKSEVTLSKDKESLQNNNESEYFSKLYKTIISNTKKLLNHISIVEVLFTLLLLYLYMLVLIYTIHDGISKTFVMNFKDIILYLSLIIILSITFSSLVFNNIKSYHLNILQRHQKSDLLLILLPLTPIIQYIVLNQDILTIYNSLSIIIMMAITAIIVIISIPTLLSIFGSRVLFMSLGLSLLFLLFYMPSLALMFSWHKTGAPEIQWPIFILVFLISFYLYKKNNKLLKILVVAFFLVNSMTTLSSVLSKETNSDPKITMKKSSPVIDKMMKATMPLKPNIYLLTYDAYVANETMLQYGIDNSAQEEFITNSGFKIYKGIYSVAPDTGNTMGRILDMSYDYVETSKIIIGEGNVYKLLKNYGYKTGMIMRNGYFFKKDLPNLDFYYPKSLVSKDKIILNSILEGEFRFDAETTFSKVSMKKFIANKRAYMKSTDTPQFIYTHTGPDHSQNSGKCLPNEVKLFERRLIKSNKEMKKDINKITKNDPNAIIIINGDHGPYLTGNCTGLNSNKFLPKNKVTRLHIQDRFGSFLAIKWPKSYTVYDDKITVLQDVFPAVFATLLKDKSIFTKLKMKPITIKKSKWVTSGVNVKDGIIDGGVHSGEALFLEK